MPRSNHCHVCVSRLGYSRVEYVERELVPTADGGDYVRLLLPFCSSECLAKWLEIGDAD